MVIKKSWEQYRQSGLGLFINGILHVFGWALVFETDDAGICTGCYPARVRFRGFDEASVSESHKRIADYLAENIDDLKAEAYE